MTCSRVSGVLAACIGSTVLEPIQGERTPLTRLHAMTFVFVCELQLTSLFVLCPLRTAAILSSNSRC